MKKSQGLIIVWNGCNVSWTFLSIARDIAYGDIDETDEYQGK